MKLFPSENIELTTERPIQEVREMLEDNIRPKTGPVFGFKRTDVNQSFQGDFVNDKMEIQRIITGRNSFLPQIKGYIQANTNGTKLVASLKVHPLVVAFMVFWFIGVLTAFVVIIVGVVMSEIHFLVLLMPLFMMALGFGLIHFGFNRERKNSIDDLKKTIQGTEKTKR